MLPVSLRDTSDLAPLPKTLSAPWIDRIVAAIACIPFAFSLQREMRNFGFNPAWIIANGNFILLVAAMLVRRTPTRITLHPLLWLLAFTATYWLFLLGRFADIGVSVAPSWVIFALSFASFVFSIWARVSLGRSIGLVPAQRGLVTKGAYRYMRHPIYTGIYFSYTALALQNWSMRNASIFVVGAALFVVKSFVEEEFLRRDVEYERYMSRVPWRWLPYVI
jgi:protein-S-isoprenylcysteine O-methyltransferase Ste14